MLAGALVFAKAATSILESPRGAAGMLKSPKDRVWVLASLFRPSKGNGKRDKIEPVSLKIQS